MGRWRFHRADYVPGSNVQSVRDMYRHRRRHKREREQYHRRRGEHEEADAYLRGALEFDRLLKSMDRREALKDKKFWKENSNVAKPLFGST